MINHPLDSDPAWLTMRRIVEAREHDITVLESMVKGRDAEIEKIKGQRDEWIKESARLGLSAETLKARLAEEIENAATYKQERDEIVVNYETVAAQLTEAHRQNADLMAIIDKRDEALGFIPLDKGMDMMDELREAKARLAEAEALLVEGTRFPMLTGERADWLIRARDWLGSKRPADSASLPRPTCGKCGLVDYGADKPLFCTDDGCPLRPTSTVAEGAK